MKEFNGTRGMGAACQELHKLLKSQGDRSLLVGITGTVASGKTKFTRELIGHAETISRRPVVTLPFDLWINPQSPDSKTYAGRFFLDDFKSAVRCARQGLHFLVPRYDLYRKGITGDCRQIKPTGQEVFWEGRGFGRVELTEDAGLKGSAGTYLEAASRGLYDFFSNEKQSIYMADGTLVAQKDLRQFYDLLIFISTPWVNRIANMVRRFNRNEVFGLTTGTVSEYVQFLIDEAKLCADEEVFSQLDQDIIKIEYSPMNLSNYLDLWYLKELVAHSPEAAHWVGADEVDQAIVQFIVKLHDEYEPAVLRQLRHELEHLALAKHLLCLENKDQVLQELSVILR